jgi:hypothetical protein
MPVLILADGLRYNQQVTKSIMSFNTVKKLKEATSI